MDETLDIVDADGEIIGRASRSECHGDPGLIHRAVHVFVFNRRGDLYLQKRSMQKDIQPGKWDTSVGGHLNSGEEYSEAARREAAEELGIEGFSLEHMYDYAFRNEIESENIRSFRTAYDGPIEPNPEEISEGRFWSRREIEGQIGRCVFTPQFEVEYHRYADWESSS